MYCTLYAELKYVGVGILTYKVYALGFVGQNGIISQFEEV